MTTKRKQLARKRPVQQRAQETVEAILEAAIQVFTVKGYDKTSVSAIAERAGVAVGSIYQYFASKDAIVVALMERHMGIIASTSIELAEQVRLSHPPLEQVVQLFVDNLVHLYAKNRLLTKVLFEEAPRPAETNQVQARLMEDVAAAVTLMFLDYPEIAPERLPLAPIFSVMTCDAMMRYIALMPVDIVPQEDLTEELSYAVYRYLTAPPRQALPQVSGPD
jgi:AcrR family transcriptional regulator